MGYVRVRVDGSLYDLNEKIELDKNLRHTVEIVWDRLILREGVRSRLTDSVEDALRLTDGALVISILPKEEGEEEQEYTHQLLL